MGSIDTLQSKGYPASDSDAQRPGETVEDWKKRMKAKGKPVPVDPNDEFTQSSPPAMTSGTN